MNTPSKLICLLAAALLSPLAHAGKDITFTIPVKLEKMDPLVSSVIVVCAVGNDQTPTLVMNASNTAAVTGGAYQGNLSATLSIPDDKLGLVKKWNCSLRLGATGVNGLSAIDTYGQHWTKAAPGAVADQSGNF